MSKIADLNNRIESAQKSYFKSLTSAITDSVDIAIQIDCMEKEMTVAKRIYNQLFPEQPI